MEPHCHHVENQHSLPSPQHGIDRRIISIGQRLITALCRGSMDRFPPSLSVFYRFTIVEPTEGINCRLKISLFSTEEKDITCCTNWRGTGHCYLCLGRYYHHTEEAEQTWKSLTVRYVKTRLHEPLVLSPLLYCSTTEKLASS